jgi:hypothetical protein
MSKFTALCEKVEKLLREQEGVVPTDPNAVAPAAPAPVEGAGDPAAGDQQPPAATDQSDIHIVTNDQIKDLFLNLKDYLTKNLGGDNALVKALVALGTINNSDDDIKKIYDKIISIVNPEQAQANPDIPVPETETETA